MLYALRSNKVEVEVHSIPLKSNNSVWDFGWLIMSSGYALRSFFTGYINDRFYTTDALSVSDELCSLYHMNYKTRNLTHYKFLPEVV